jgi:ribonuclease-3
MHHALRDLKPSIKQRVSTVESIVNYRFRDPKLVMRALTHPSAVEADQRYSYERLEFLGDSIVGLIVGDEAYRRFPDADEGMLTKIKISVVNGAFLADTARCHGFDRLIVFGSSEEASKLRGMRSALEDAFEAITAALYLDGGLQAARTWVLHCLGEYITLETARMGTSPKSDLQEKMQALGKVVTYRIVTERGPAHAPLFTAEVLVDKKVMGSGTGETKKQAEAAAALLALSGMID